MAHAKDPNVEAQAKGDAFDKQLRESEERAAQRPQGQPAPLPTNPLTGDDSADDGQGDVS